MDQIIVECSIWIEAMPERAWQAVTIGEQLTQWYSPGSPWEVPKLEVGETVYFHHSPNEYHAGAEVVTLKAKIVELIGGHTFAVRWEFEAYPDYEMITTFTVDAEEGGTRVTMTETGYETEEQAQQTQEGYSMSLVNLKAYLEGGPIPY